MPVSIALLGAGIFAREEYIPALKANNDVSLKAIYSRSKESAEKLAAEYGQPVDIYYDSPSETGKSLDDLLASPGVEGVISCLPITVQPETIKTALTAGKHVLSEKPIAKDTSVAKELIDFSPNGGLWMVAENFRFLEVLAKGRAAIEQIGGDLVTFHVNVFTLIDDNDKFYQTAWRQTPDYQGGFLLDGGVHFVAGLRHLLGGVGQDISSLAAYTALVIPKLAPRDTVHAILATNSGRSGSLSVSFGAAFESGFEIVVVTTNGRVCVTPTTVKTAQLGKDGKKQETTDEFAFGSGVAAEVEAFVASIQSGTVDKRATPQQALQDLAIVQAMLESGEAHGASRQIRPCSGLSNGTH